MIIFNLIYVCFRFSKTWYSLCDGKKGGHQDHQQGEAERVRTPEGREGDRHHEADRAPERSFAIRRLREPEVPLPGPGARQWRRAV